MKYKRCKDMSAWQKAKNMAIQIYKTTQQCKFSRDYSFAGQIRRSLISIPCNIAEDFERGSRKEFIQFLYIAKASAGELRSQLLITPDLVYLEKKISNDLRSEVIQTSEQLGALILALKRKVNK